MRLSIFYNPLLKAVSHNDIPAIETAIANNANLNSKDNEANSLLHLACAHGHISIVEQLLENNVAIDELNFQYQTPLQLAVKNNYLNIAESLLNHHASPNGIKPLYQGHEDKISYIFDFMYLNAFFLFFYRQAIGTDLPPVLCLFISIAASREAFRMLHNSLKQTKPPLIMAIEQNQSNMVKLLLEYKADANVMASDSQTTALHWAVQSKNEAIVEALIEAGSDINARDAKGDTPLDQAYKMDTYSNDDAIITLLKQHGATCTQEPLPSPKGFQYV